MEVVERNLGRIIDYCKSDDSEVGVAPPLVDHSALCCLTEIKLLDDNNPAQFLTSCECSCLSVLFISVLFCCHRSCCDPTPDHHRVWMLDLLLITVWMILYLFGLEHIMFISSTRRSGIQIGCINQTCLYVLETSMAFTLTMCV